MTEIVIVVITIDRALFQKRRYLFKIFLFELVRRCDENVFLFKTTISVTHHLNVAVFVTDTLGYLDLEMTIFRYLLTS